MGSKNDPKTRLNGDREWRLPNNVNISIMDLEGEALILYLDAAGIYVSTGARAQCIVGPKPCYSRAGDALRGGAWSIRFSLGRPQPSEISYMY